KVAGKTTQTSVLEVETSTLTINEDTPAQSPAVRVTNSRPTKRSRNAASPRSSSMEIESISSTEIITTVANAAKEAKPKVPDVNPWTKRPRHVPDYAQMALDHLCKADSALAPLVEKHPYLIYADHDTNYFRVLTRTILGQQIHWKAARSIIFKFVSFYFPGKVTAESLDEGDKTFPSPNQVLATGIDSLRSCGLSERKASYVQDLARHFVEGKITFTDKAMLQSMTDEELAAQLLCVRGIGPWTVDMFMMDSLERLDVLPTLDLGVRKGMEKHFRSEYKNGVWGTIVEEEIVVEAEDGQVKTIKKKSAAKGKGKGKAKNGEMTCEDMERMAERWRPYRSIASWRGMDTIITPVVRDSNGDNSPSHSRHPNVTVENIQVVTSISDAILQDDGSITPTAATVIGTSVFENGVLSGTVQQDANLLQNSSGSSSNDAMAISKSVATERLDIQSGAGSGSGNTTRSTSPNPASSSPSQQQQLQQLQQQQQQQQQTQQQQQQTQQQQRQRELHYESANAVLVPPLNFALVAPGVYRSGHPNKHNFPFMRKLGLKVIVQMSEEPYAPDLEEFLERENIRRIHYKIEGNKEPFIEIDEQVISSALVNILDARNHPLLIHCAKGKHRIGCLIGCLRKIQNWSMTSIFDEYRRFAGSKVLADQEFIEIFSAKVPYSLEHKPFWL
ncbi:hypothetical protein BGX28_009037, partial [Mortierella sp. GBA30]